MLISDRFKASNQKRPKNSSFDYELDATGNGLSVTDASGKYTPYGYDPQQQLKSENKWSAKTPGTRSYQYAFAYDPNGNRLEQWFNGVRTSYTYGDNNEMLTAGAGSFTYDHFGNTLTGPSVNYTWDFESHLLNVDDGTAATDDHEYDGDSRRMRSKLAGASDWTNFIYDELETSYPALLCEYTLISTTFTIVALNTWGLGLISSNRGGTKRYFHFDGLGSTMALTNSSGTVTDGYFYSAFGVTVSGGSGSSVNPFKFMGQVGAFDDTALGSTYGLLFSRVGFFDPATSLLLSDFG